MSTLQRTAAPQVAPDPEATAGREGGPARAEHTRRRTRLAEQYAATPAGGPVRLAKRTSNLFRARRASAERLDVRGLDHVLAIDPVARTADVQGITTYEHLVDATLAHGLMPLVVPQLKTITVGGAVSGLGIESSSVRNGLPHESVIEMEVLTGGGEVLLARPDNEHRALFHGFPNSYGTLGYALRLTIELEPVRPSCACATCRSPTGRRASTRWTRSARRGLTTATGSTSSTARPSAPASCT